MSTALAFPYKTIPAGICVLGDWRRFDQHDVAEPVSDHISGWDYDSHINLGRSIELNPKDVLGELDLGRANVGMSVIVTAETGPTSYRWLVHRSDIPIAATWEHDIRFEISSHRLAQRLSLTTEVVLSGDVGKGKPFTPNQKGSRLFRDTKVIQLEGTLGRFPMEMLDFSKGLPFLNANNALWYLDWDPSRPESQFLGTVLLYINSGHPEVSNLVQAAEPTILSILRCDVIRAMCETMLQIDEFRDQYADYDVNTLGGQVREWLIFAFGEENPELLRSKLDSYPGRFEAHLQSAFS